MTSTGNKDKAVAVVMILQSLPPMPVGGAEIQALRLGKELVKRGVAVTLLCPAERGHKGKGELDGMKLYKLHSFLNLILDLLFFLQKKIPKQPVTIEYNDSITDNNTITRKIGLGSRLRYNIFLVNAFFFLLKRKKQFHIIHTHTIEWPAYVGALLSRWFNKKFVVKDSTMNGIFNMLRFPSGAAKQKTI